MGPGPLQVIDHESSRAQAINPQPPMAQDWDDQEQQQQQMQQSQQLEQQQPASARPVSTQPTETTNGIGGTMQSLTSAGFLNTVRNAAARTTDILGIGSNSEGSNSGGATDVRGTAFQSSGKDTQHSSITTAQQHSSSALPPPSPPTSSSPSPSSSPVFSPRQHSPTSTPNLNSTLSKPATPRPSQDHIDNTIDKPTVAIVATAPAADSERTVMTSSQSDVMTMETFQMNRANSFGYDGQDFSDQTYAAGGFPESDINQTNDTSTSSQDGEDGFNDATTAFVYANEKRFNDFHALFRSVPDDEKLIEGKAARLIKSFTIIPMESWIQHHTTSSRATYLSTPMSITPIVCMQAHTSWSYSQLRRSSFAENEMRLRAFPFCSLFIRKV